MKALGLKRKKILLVEDDSSILEALKELWENEGYEVDCATNGLEALDLLRSGKLPNVILLDLRMPVLDGAEFRKLQLADSRICHIPVLVMSADGSRSVGKDRIDANEYLRKPLMIDTLVETMKRYTSD